MLIAIYVDDLVVCAFTESFPEDITAQLAKKFRCVDMGEITWCLGMRIMTSANRNVIMLDLDHYIQTILSRYKFDQLQSVPTPMLLCFG